MITELLKTLLLLIMLIAIIFAVASDLTKCVFKQVTFKAASIFCIVLEIIGFLIYSISIGGITFAF